MQRNRNNDTLGNPLLFQSDAMRPYPTANYPVHETFNFNERLNQLGLNEITLPEYGISQRYLTPKEFSKPELIHNNVAENPMIENLIEYTLVVDSGDRDITKYPNPFDYKVLFSPNSNTKDAYINRTFENVKYIKLETGILPRRFNFTRTDMSFNVTDRTTLLNSGTLRASNTVFTLTFDPSSNFAVIEDTLESSVRRITFAVTKPYPELIDTTYEFNYNTNTSTVISAYKYVLSTDSLENDKFLLLKIDEYQDVNEMATNQEVSRCFSIMFPDFVNGNFFYTDTHYVDKIFRFSSLGNIKNFTIKIQNSKGVQLKTNEYSDFLDKHLDTSVDYQDTKDATGATVRDYRSKTNYIRHPLYDKFQNTLLFKIGVVENDIDKGIFN